MILIVDRGHESACEYGFSRDYSAGDTKHARESVESHGVAAMESHVS